MILAAGVVTMAVMPRHWLLREPFVISRATITDCETVEVVLTDRHGARGRGASHGVTYAGETAATMIAEIERVRPAIEAGFTRDDLIAAMPAGGARCAVDAAMWDLAAKRDGTDPFAANGVGPAPVASARTLGIRTPDAFEHAARVENAATLKIKVGADDPLAQVAAVRRGAPHADIIVDPNQAWSVDQLKALVGPLAELGVAMIEQPIPVGVEVGLDGWTSPVPLFADELVDTADDLARARGRFAGINIKLEKAGGLTAALRLADAAVAQDFALMVGCMGGSSLTMAPAMVLAQRCRWIDLDAPLFLTDDDAPGLSYQRGVVVRPHLPELWG